MPRSPRSKSLPSSSTTGALPKASTDGQKPGGAPVKAAAAKEPVHQTHGGYTPITGPITHAHQLYKGANLAKGSLGSFQSVEAYTGYLTNMTDAQLHKHAVEEARIVPIDDRTRLIRRLEQEWYGVTAHRVPAPPPRQGFSKEQREAQEALRAQMLSRLSPKR